MKTAEAAKTTESAAVTEQGAHGAPQIAISKKGARRKKDTPKAPTAAKGAKTKGMRKKAAKRRTKLAKRGAKEDSSARPQSKGAKIIEMLGRARGASLAEIMTTTDWQAHSVRGFLSTAVKKHSLKIRSSKNEAGERTYKIEK